MAPMPSKTRWGYLVAGALAGLPGCAGSTPSPAPAPPLPEPAPSATAAPSTTAPATSQFGPLVPVLPTPQPGASNFWGETVQLRYGRGTFRYTRVEPLMNRLPTCPLGDGGAECGVFSLSTTGKSPADGSWMGSAEAAGGKPGALRPIPSRWAVFTPGRDGVYAFQERATRIDFIDDQGAVTPFLEEASLEETSIAKLFEVGDRKVLLFNGEDWTTHLAEVIPGTGGKPGRRGKVEELPMSFIPRWRQSAQGVRQIEEQKKMAMIGEPMAVALPGEKDTWALVWTEGLAPPYDWPHDKPYKRKNKRGGKHECGGPGSRPLSDKSVEKRIHATRFKGLSRVSDVVLKSTNELDGTLEPPVAANDRGIEVNGVTYDAGGKEVARRTAAPRGSTTSLQLASDELLTAIGFDEASQQGLLVVQTGETFWRRAFDASGAFLGEPVKLRKDPEINNNPLTRIDGHWYVVGGYGRSLLSLDDDRDFTVDKDGSAAQTVVAQGPGKALITIINGPHLKGVSVDLKDGTVSAPVTLLSWDRQERYHNELAWLPAAPPEPPRVVSLKRDKASRKLLAVEQAPLVADAEWKTLWEVESGTPEGTADLHRVPGDLVAAFGTPSKTTLRWLRAGKTVTLDEGLAEFDGAERSETPGGSALLLVVAESESKRWALLPSTPGIPRKGDAPPGLGESCAHGIRTNASTVVLVCGEGTPGEKPGLRLGLRALKLAEKTP